MKLKTFICNTVASAVCENTDRLTREGHIEMSIKYAIIYKKST